MVKLKYVKMARGRNGRGSYWYFRRTGRHWRLPGEPGAIEFACEYQRLLDVTRPSERVIAAKPVSSSATGYIYFLKAGPRWKIGFSTKPLSRASALQTGSPHKIETLLAVRGLQRHERMLHAKLAFYRRTGEWFDDAPQVRKTAHVVLGRGTSWLDETERERNADVGNA